MKRYFRYLCANNTNQKQFLTKISEITLNVMWNVTVTHNNDYGYFSSILIGKVKVVVVIPVLN